MFTLDLIYGEWVEQNLCTIVLSRILLHARKKGFSTFQLCQTILAEKEKDEIEGGKSWVRK